MDKHDIPLKHIRQLAQKMRKAGLDEIELRTQGSLLKLRYPPQITPSLPAVVAEELPLTPLHASMPGKVLLRHPSHDRDYVQIGQTVKSNELLALLKVGAFYLPLRSPVDGVVTRIEAQQEQAVEYGSNIMWLSECSAQSVML